LPDLVSLLMLLAALQIASAELAKQRERAGAKMETIYFNSSEIPLTPLEDIRDREVGRKGVVVRIPYDEKEEDEGSDEVEGGSARSDSAVASQSVSIFSVVLRSCLPEGSPY
jgi:hypothetical protein